MTWPRGGTGSRSHGSMPQIHCASRACRAMPRRSAMPPPPPPPPSYAAPVLLAVVVLAIMIAITLFLTRKKPAKSAKKLDASPSEVKCDITALGAASGLRPASSVVPTPDTFTAIYEKCGLVRVPGSKVAWQTSAPSPASQFVSNNTDAFIAMYKSCGLVRVPGSKVAWQTKPSAAPPAPKAAPAPPTAGPAPLEVKSTPTSTEALAYSPSTEALSYSPDDCVEHPKVGEWGRYVVGTKPDTSTAQSKALALDWYLNPDPYARCQHRSDPFAPEAAKAKARGSRASLLKSFGKSFSKKAKAAA